MNDKRKRELIEKYKDSSIEGLDSCLHGIKLYKTCVSCGRYIDKDGNVIWNAKGSWDEVPNEIKEAIKKLN